MIDCIIETHWRSVQAVNPASKEAMENTRVKRFGGYTLQPMEERKKRAAAGRYPFNILTEETYD